MYRTQGDRGYTLIIVLVILAVLLILGAGALRLASREVESAASGTHSTTMLACARAARQMLQSQLRLNANFPTSFSLTTGQANASDPSPSKLTVASGGDPDAPPMATNVTNVQLVSPQNCGRGSSGSGNFRNLSNQVLGRNGASAGSCRRIIARCEDNSGRVQEVEFTIHYGLN